MELPSLGRCARTGPDGLAVLDGVPAGRHMLRVSGAEIHGRSEMVTIGAGGGSTVSLDVSPEW